MENQRLPSGGEFWSRFSSIVSACGIISALFVAIYLVLLLRMPAEQMKSLGLIVAMVFVPSVPIAALIFRRTVAPIMFWLDKESRDVATLDVQRDAFQTVVNLPGRILSLGFFSLVIPAVLSVLSILAFVDDFELYYALLMLAAILSCAGLSSIIEGFVLKHWLGPLRAALTLAVEDPRERSELTRPVSLVTKLQVLLSACTLVPVILVALVSHTRSTIPLEEFVHSLQRQVLASAIIVHREFGDEGLGGLDEHEVARAISASILLIDRETGSTLFGNSNRLTDKQRRLIRESDQSRGAENQLRAENLFVWQESFEPRHVIVVASPRAQLVGDEHDLGAVFAILLMACLGLAAGVGWLVAQDVGGATQQLRRAADRMASGDLRRMDVLESEDELGTLARAFDTMASSLRMSVGEVAETADGVDEATGTISEISEELREVATGQGRDVKLVVAAMEAIESRVSGIATASDGLRLLVEESTHSILELGASGDELNATAGSLSARIEDVSTSAEQIVGSVRKVRLETATLEQAADDTSSSMEQMASAMRHVDTTAATTADLSEQVVAASELGLEKVRDTIAGIESIRTATETAQGVILSLGSRAQEIGGILDVIDGVADQTNLLALNAAIIASQAGEHGRAFSVVADQIKEVADRVLTGTKEISGLINSVQEESKSAIDAMEDGSRSVAEGVARSNEAGESLEEITRLSRDSGFRIREIVESVREQTKAAGHVVGLMERVRSGVQAIGHAASEQEQGHELVFEATQSMREVSQQLHLTTTEQASDLARIRVSVSGVQDQMESINESLKEQSKSCIQVVGFLEEVSSRSVANERTAGLLSKATEKLTEQALRLRDGMGRFQR